MVMIEIDFNSEEAIYIQLRNQIIIGIAREDIKNGESLPSVRQLADDLGVNMHTVNKAYTMLKQDGYLQLDRRKGAVVSVSVDKTMHVQNIHSDMEMIVAEAICKDISLRELQQIVSNMYGKFQQLEQSTEYKDGKEE